MTMSNQGGTGSGGRFPLDNLTYDLITILYEKSKALEAYDKYMQDAQGQQEVGQLLQQIRQQDEQHIQQLRQHLGRLLGSEGGMQSRTVGGSSGGMGGSTISGSNTGSMGGTTSGTMGGSTTGSSDVNRS